MAGVAQLVRALDCGSRGRGFNSPHSPQKAAENKGFWNAPEPLSFRKNPLQPFATTLEI